MGKGPHGYGAQLAVEIIRARVLVVGALAEGVAASGGVAGAAAVTVGVRGVLVEVDVD